jgi:hypothetical protein
MSKGGGQPNGSSSIPWGGVVYFVRSAAREVWQLLAGAVAEGLAPSGKLGGTRAACPGSALMRAQTSRPCPGVYIR